MVGLWKEGRTTMMWPSHTDGPPPVPLTTFLGLKRSARIRGSHPGTVARNRVVHADRQTHRHTGTQTDRHTD